jgi:hypothetical protein
MKRFWEAKRRGKASEWDEREYVALLRLCDHEKPDGTSLIKPGLTYSYCELCGRLF